VSGISKLGPLLVFVLALALAGCPKKDEVIIETAEGKDLTAADIDRDPMALLPGGMVGLAYVDAPKLFASQFGEKLLTIARARSPVPDAAGFDPARDLKYAYVGFYSFEGADIAAVAIGNFDKEKIERAAESNPRTPLGSPVVKGSYAGRATYTANNIGFVVLTKQTVLFGNETGLRRMLDRIKEGRVARQVPEWMLELLRRPNAPVIGGADLRAQPVTDAVRQEAAFLNGVETIRGLGNFEPPGLNLAGTLTYGDAKGAELGAAALKDLHQKLQNYGWIMALLNIAQPVKKLDVAVKDREAQFVAGVDGQAVGQLLDKLADLAKTMPENVSPPPPAPAATPAPTAPGPWPGGPVQ
jgi:hypothetical protein